MELQFHPDMAKVTEVFLVSSQTVKANYETQTTPAPLHPL
jgi:hypothetical protein